MVAKGRLKDFHSVLRGALYQDLWFPGAKEPIALRKAIEEQNPTLGCDRPIPLPGKGECLLL